MAIQSIAEKVTLKIELDGGIINGKQKINSKSFSKIKTDAQNEDLHETASVMASLQEKDLVSIKRVETSALTEDEEE